MGSHELEQRVEAARRFNRFYTRHIGLLRRGAYDSPFSLTEVRVLYELAHRARPTATELGRDLGLDAGYLSRILRGFERRALVTRTRSPADGRQSHLALTALGRKVFAPLDARSHDEVAALLSALAPAEQEHVIAAMQKIQRLLGRDGVSAPPPAAALVLREPQARGSGLGTRLVDECVRFARQAGYRKLMLWTQSELRAARRLYQAAGFRVVRKERNHSFGKALVSETWELDL